MIFYYIIVPIGVLLLLKKTNAAGNAGAVAPKSSTPKSTATAAQKSGTSANQPQSGSTASQLEIAGAGLATAYVAKNAASWLSSLTSSSSPNAADEGPEIDQDEVDDASEDIAASSASATDDDEDFNDYDDENDGEDDYAGDNSDFSMDA